MSSLNKSKRVWITEICVLSVFILILNFMTHLYADDYTYFFSFADNTRITGFGDIIKSMATHYQMQNGRVVAHFFVQLFLMFPKAVFNIVNTAMFLLQLLLIYNLTKKKNNNIFLFAMIFAAVWVFEPAFGQVNLWLDGSCNYLWSLVFGILYITMYCNYYLEGEQEYSTAKKVLSVILSAAVGAYSENFSFALIAGAFMFLVLGKFVAKRKWCLILIVDLIVAFAGYCFMIFAPATLLNKAGERTLGALVTNFLTITETYYSTYKILLFAFAFLFAAAFAAKVESKKIVASFIFLLISLMSSFIFITAAYYPERSMCGSTITLIIAIFYLAFELWEARYQFIVSGMGLCLVVVTLYMMVFGVFDVAAMYKKTVAREHILSEAKVNGENEIRLEKLAPATKYSAAMGLSDVKQNPEEWPNNSMEQYWGINAIIGNE